MNRKKQYNRFDIRMRSHLVLENRGGLIAPGEQFQFFSIDSDEVVSLVSTPAPDTQERAREIILVLELMGALLAKKSIPLRYASQLRGKFP